MSKKKIAVLVSGGGTNFQALIDARTRGELGGGEFAVCLSSNPDAYALERAAAAEIPTVCVPRKEYASREGYTSAVLAALEPYAPDLIVLSGFMCILSPEFTARYRNAVINVHPALIPAFCGEGFYGLRVHEAALAYGVKVSGASVHFVTEQTDGGPLILQKAVDVLEGDTPETLQQRIMEQAEWKLLPKAVRLFCEDRLTVDGRFVRIRNY